MTSDEPAARWCLPDWRNSEAYPGPGELSPLGWRIEFLRRNPEYREDWQRTDLTSHNARAAAVCARWALPRAWPPTSSPLDLVRRARIRNLIDANADATLPVSLLAYTGGSPAAPADARTAGGPVFSGGSKLVRCLGWILGVPRPAEADPQYRREAAWSRYLQAPDDIAPGAHLAAHIGRA